MKATEKESQVIDTAMRWKLSCLFAIGTLIVFIAATYIKMPEYRPIAISYRTVVANTAYQPSISRVTDISVSVNIACTSTLAGGQAGTWELKTSPTSGGTYTTIATVQNSNNVALAIAITASNSNGSPLVGKVPPTYWYKLVPTQVTGTPTLTIVGQSQESQL